MLLIKQLVFGYSKDQPPVLMIPHWQVKTAGRLFVRGASGSGKSTLLNLIAGLLIPQQGEIQIEDTVINQLTGHQRDAFRGRQIGMVFQRFNLIPYLTVLDNLRLASHFSGLSASDAQQRAIQLLEKLGLSVNLHKRYANELSVGQQQRVAIARALINQPALLLVDEPTSALDSQQRDQFINVLLNQLAETGTALIFVSHDEALAGHFSEQLAIEQFQPQAIENVI